MANGTKIYRSNAGRQIAGKSSKNNHNVNEKPSGVKTPKLPVPRIASKPKISNHCTRCERDTGCKHPGRLNKAEPFRKPSENVRCEPLSEVVRTPIARADVNGRSI